jgi:hypothetical protein
MFWIGCDEARISYRIVMDFVIKVEKLGFSKESNCMSTYITIQHANTDILDHLSL